MTSQVRTDTIYFQTLIPVEVDNGARVSYLRNHTVRLAAAMAFCFASLTIHAQNLRIIGTTQSVASNSGELNKRAHFFQETASAVSRKIANWVMDSGDNRNLPFLIVDKVEAKVFVFDAQGQLLGAASALLGLAVGDDAVPGIGERKLSTIRPEERITEAGRFVASLDRSIQGEGILWVNYDSALSLHRVVTSNTKEQRAQRLATPSPLDNRISFGCINVSVKFYETVVSPAFTGTQGIVYILPETRSAREVFGSYDVDAGTRTARQ